MTTATALTPAVATALRVVAHALQQVADAWQDNDQAAWDESKTLIATALGMSLDEAAIEIEMFVEENAPNA